jgi:hypothetical protein
MTSRNNPAGFCLAHPPQHIQRRPIDEQDFVVFGGIATSARQHNIPCPICANFKTNRHDMVIGENTFCAFGFGQFVENRFSTPAA